MDILYLAQQDELLLDVEQSGLLFPFSYAGMALV
jgi:hypothetical protein